MPDLQDFRSSMLRFCADFAQEMMAGGYVEALTVVDLDAHAGEDTLPAGDLLGPHGFQLDSDAGNHIITVAFGVSTSGDENNFRLYRVLNQLHKLLEPDNSIDLYQADTGDDMGTAKLMNGTTVLPMVNTKLRALQFIQVTMGTAEVSPSP
jgi:hypothetical protein